jgi:hypothetical protein
MSMRQTTAINVPFTQDNIKKCRCTICPVQRKSQCVTDDISRIPDSLKTSPPNSKAIPNVYCSQGAATCTDIDTALSCICPSCLVFSEYKLINGQPVEYYCRDGKAHSK